MFSEYLCHGWKIEPRFYECERRCGWLTVLLLHFDVFLSYYSSDKIKALFNPPDCILANTAFWLWVGDALLYSALQQKMVDEVNKHIRLQLCLESLPSSSLVERTAGLMTGIFTSWLTSVQTDLRIQKASFKSPVHCSLNGLDIDAFGYELLQSLYGPFVVPFSLTVCHQLGSVLLLLSTGKMFYFEAVMHTVQLQLMSLKHVWLLWSLEAILRPCIGMFTTHLPVVLIKDGRRGQSAG